jgi:glycoprotein endo-alpha-1,2-mannosidase
VRTLRLIIVCFALLAVPAAAQARSWTSIFYYPWYGTPARDGAWEHWLGPGGSALGISSNYYPARGLYSSSDRRVAAAQMREIAATGVREIVYSWWGWGSPEDVRLPIVMRPANAVGLSVAVHLEPYAGRTQESVADDIEHLQMLGINRFFVYQPFENIGPGDWAALRKGAPGVQLFAETGLVGRAAAAGFDGIYTYDVLHWGGSTFRRLCRQAHQAGLLCLPSVGPGYKASRATGDLRVKPRRDGATYDAMWKAAIHSAADGVTVTSYNEWHEGTQIEPARARRGGAAAVAFESYDGAYGLYGRASERAYLDRTTYWTDAFVRARASGFGHNDP